MESRKNTQTPRMDRKALILTVVGAALVIAIIVIAVVLMQRSAGDDYRQNYEAAMEYYVAGDYDEAINSAKLAYAEDATEEAVLIIARSYAGKGDYESAVSELEAWTGSHGSGQEAGTLLEEYRSHLTDNTDEPDTETVTVAGTEYPIDSQTLVVSGSALTSADMSAIATLSELTSLSLNDCSLTDISALSSLSKLTDLSLEDNDITDLSPLSGLSSLKTLYLSGNENISSLEPLYGLDNLATLDIRGREITDEEFEALQTELPNCTILTDTPTETVTEITLGGQTFNSDVTSLAFTGADITDISALATCTQLESLDVSYTDIDSISVVAGMPNLRSLDFTSTNVSSISPILALNNLEVLWFRDTNVTNISALAGHTTLTELEISGNDIEDYSVLETLTGLSSLILDDAGLQDSDLEILSRMTWLDNLYIRNNPDLSREAVNELIAALPNTNISAPDFSDVTLGDQMFPVDSTQVNASGSGVENLDGIEQFQNLSVLTLSDNPGIDISNISSVPTLTYLELARCELTDISALSNLTALEGLDLMQNDITDITPLRHMRGLTELHLSLYENLSDISALSQLDNLYVLSLNGTAVTDLSAIADLTNLQTLDIEGCEIDDITPLLGLKNLRTLYAAGCGFSQQEIDEIGQALPNSTIYT